MLFIPKVVNVVYHTDLRIWKNMEKSLHPWDKSQLFMVYDLLNNLLDFVCWYFLKDFCIYMFISDSGM